MMFSRVIHRLIVQ
jgi:hypothetical protein